MINYKLLHDSTEFYEDRGFLRIESPWTVTEQVSNITKPEGAKDFKLVHEDNKVLVASGEQSFLYLYLKGFLPRGKFQTTTPCFRKDSFDTWHTKYFIKNELIVTDKVDKEELHSVVAHAADFFLKIFGRININHISDTQIDLEYKGIELGSYGIRSCDYLSWVYGTGVAEPRTSMILKKYKINYL